MSTSNNNLQAAAEAHALEVLGKTQFKKNKDAAQAIASDFTAGVQWQALQAAAPAPASDEVLAKIEAELAEYMESEFTMTGRVPSGTPESYVFPYTRDVTVLLARVRQAEAKVAEPSIPVWRIRECLNDLKAIAKNDYQNSEDDEQGDVYANKLMSLLEVANELGIDLKGGQQDA